MLPYESLILRIYRLYEMLHLLRTLLTRFIRSDFVYVRRTKLKI